MRAYAWTAGGAVAPAPSVPLPDTAAASGEPAGAGRRGFWPIPAIVALAMMLWGIGTPSYSRDEAATLSAVQRPFPDLIRMLSSIDAVHGAYYVVLWPLVHAFGTSGLVTRLPSAVGMAVAAAAVCGLGSRLVSARAGLFAGLVFALGPQVTYYGQTARPYGLATGLAAVASYLLVRAVQSSAAAVDQGDHQPGLARLLGWMTGYGACLAVLGYIHLFGLLLAVPHLFPVVVQWVRRGRKGTRLALAWLGAVLCAVGLVTPVILAGLQQRGLSMAWAKAPWYVSVRSLVNLAGSVPMAEVAGVALLCAIVVSALAGRAQLRARFPADVFTLAVPWLILPPLILIVASSVTPLFVFRYVMFCAPAAALLIGVALSALDWLAGTAVLVILTVLAIPLTLQMRTPAGHGLDIRWADVIISRDARPGDALMYMTISEPVEMAYPYGMRQLANVELGENASQSGTLGGTWAPLTVVQRRVKAARGIWYVQLTPHSAGRAVPPEILRRYGFRVVHVWHIVGVRLTLYARLGHRRR